MIKKHMITLMFLLAGCGFIYAQEVNYTSFCLKTAVKRCKDEQCRVMHDILMRVPRIDVDLGVVAQLKSIYMTDQAFSEEKVSFKQWFLNEFCLPYTKENAKNVFLRKVRHFDDVQYKNLLQNVGMCEGGMFTIEQLKQARQKLVDEITSKMNVDEEFIKPIWSVNVDKISTEDHRNAAAFEYQVLYDRLFRKFQKSLHGDA